MFLVRYLQVQWLSWHDSSAQHATQHEVFDPSQDNLSCAAVHDLQQLGRCKPMHAECLLDTVGVA